MKTAEDYSHLPLGDLARLAANQANELTNVVRQNKDLERALHMRRLQVASLCEDLGRGVDSDCAGAIRRELAKQAEAARG